MKKSELAFGALRVPLDFLAAVGAFMLAYYIRPITDLIPGVQYEFFPEQLPAFGEYVTLALASSGFLVLLFVFNNLYSLKNTHRFTREMLKIVALVTAWLMFIIAYHFLVIHQLFFSRIALAHIWLFSIILVIVGRVAINALQIFLLRFKIGKRRVLFVGVNDIADRVYSAFSRDPRYNIIGALSASVRSRKKGTLKIVGNRSQLESIVKKYRIEEIIQADSDPESRNSSELLSFCRSRHIKYHFIPDLVRLQRTNVEVEMIDEMPLISLKQTPLEGWGRIFKRLFDLVFALILIILLIPVWIIVPIIIKLDSKGPAFYKSQRKYRNKLFYIYKFRSMVINADDKKDELMSQNERKGPLFKIKKDPRVTRLGKTLRKYSIDELPQLFNVLLGAVSIVGPRPHLPKEVDQYEAHHYEVFAIKPGISGLAQTSGRSHLDFEEEVKLDVFYIENWSLWLDIKIILKSIGVVFRGDGH